MSKSGHQQSGSPRKQARKVETVKTAALYVWAFLTSISLSVALGVSVSDITDAKEPSVLKPGNNAEISVTEQEEGITPYIAYQLNSTFIGESKVQGCAG